MPKCIEHGKFFCKPCFAPRVGRAVSTSKGMQQVPKGSLTGRISIYEPEYQYYNARRAGKTTAAKEAAKKIIQFGFNVKVPDEVKAGAPLIDCRCIKNPYDKTHDMVRARFLVRSDPNFDKLVKEGMDVLRAHPSPVLAVGCGYGVHRSGTVVEALRMLCAEEGIDVDVINMGKDA